MGHNSTSNSNGNGTSGANNQTTNGIIIDPNTGEEMDPSSLDTPFTDDTPIFERGLINVGFIPIQIGDTTINIRLVRAGRRRQGIKWNDANELLVDASFNTKGKTILDTISKNSDEILERYYKMLDLRANGDWIMSEERDWYLPY